MKKTFDAVKFMRQRRTEIEKDWQHRPHSEEIKYLREKYPGVVRKRAQSA